MTTKTNERRGQVLLALQNALLGEITSKVRAVTVKYTDTTIHFVAYFDGEISGVEREAMSEVETEALALFPEDHVITHEAIRLDAPQFIPKDCDWVYARKEPAPDEWLSQEAKPA